MPEKEDWKSDLEITAWEKECWVCGRKGGYITTHHTLPKHLKPKKNFLCPVCHDCHKLINQHDVRGIVAFAYKIQKSFDELKFKFEQTMDLKEHFRTLKSMVENMTENMKRPKE